MFARLAGAFVLSACIAAAVTAGVWAQPRAGGDHRYYIVTLAGPVLEEWKAALTEAGTETLDYVPEFAFKVRMNPGDANRVERLPFVVSVDPVQPSHKLARRLARGAGVRPYLLRIERGAGVATAARAVAATGAMLLRQEGALLIVLADDTQLDAMAGVLDVASIENFTLRQKHNEFGGGAVMGASLVNAAGFDGSSQTIAIADTGIGSGTAAGAHIDLPPARVQSVFNWPGTPSDCFETIMDDGALDVDSGHGTHVATTALGSGDGNGMGRGTAPAARLVLQAVENWATPSWFCSWLYGLTAGYYLVGIPGDVGQLLQQGYDAGARVHSNSWGSEVNGAYTNDSANADAFVWSHRDLSVTVSAGNSGTDADSNGDIDATSINAPATAKNVITVGASEGDRQTHYECDATLSYGGCGTQGGQNNVFTWGAAFADRYAADPIKNDLSAGNVEQMAAFSSRGPTSDGRIKPDVVAPGTWILSGYSDRYQQHYDTAPNPQNGLYQYDGWGFPLNSAYKYMGGTSMAAPLVAGGAALVRDYYQKARGHSASAALVKATLVNSAVDLLDENNDGVSDNANPIPNRHEGWGRVDLTRAIDPARQFFDETTQLSTGTRTTLLFSVADASGPLKLTLAWSDYPSTSSATINLVNDLDLEVIGPGGTTYLGNVFAGGWSATGGVADRRNNLENVYIATPAAGTWSVVVRGYNVPSGPQRFALVADGTFAGAAIQLPSVSVVASDATATEVGPTTGAFTIRRAGDTSASLTVTFVVTGTAAAGSDYVGLPGQVTIAAGASETTVVVQPIDDPVSESDETVVLTLTSSGAYDLGAPASATVTIVSEDKPPDLVIAIVTAPAAAGAGTSIVIAETTKNIAGWQGPPSETGFYLSANTFVDSGDVLLGTRQVPSLGANASHSQSTTVTIPTTTVAGTYFVLANADWNSAVPELQEGNNVRASGGIRIGPDLVVSAISGPAATTAGSSIVIAETTKNQGVGTTPSSVTAFYLSTNTNLDTADVRLGSRTVPELGTSASHTASTSVTIPATTSTGTYYLIARSDDGSAIPEAQEFNNTGVSNPLKVGADLTVTAMTAPLVAGAGGAIVVTDTTKNEGGSPAAASVTAFYLSTNMSFDASDVRIGERAIPSLDGAVSNTQSTTVTLPASVTPGTYYVVARADDGSAVVETTETNNTKSSGAVKIGPDLTVTELTRPAIASAGDTIIVNNTVKNAGGGAAPSTDAVLYLSRNTALDTSDVMLNQRVVPALAAGVSDAASTSVVIPTGTAAGIYYLLEQVDSGNTIPETSESNNILWSNGFKIGPDFQMYLLSGPASAPAGASIVVTDTTHNGGAAAGPSTTAFYLSTNATLDAADASIGSRAVPALAPSTSHAASTTVTLPASLAPGTYYIIAMADGPGVIGEISESNNTRGFAFNITSQ